MCQIRPLDRSALGCVLAVCLVLGLTGCETLGKGVFDLGNALSCAQGNDYACEEENDDYGASGSSGSEEDDDSDGPMSLGEVVQSLADSMEAMTPDEDETYEENQRMIREATERARRREEAERQREEARRREAASERRSGGMPSTSGGPEVGPTEEERRQAELEEQRRREEEARRQREAERRRQAEAERRRQREEARRQAEERRRASYPPACRDIETDRFGQEGNFTWLLERCISYHAMLEHTRTVTVTVHGACEAARGNEAEFRFRVEGRTLQGNVYTGAWPGRPLRWASNAVYGGESPPHTFTDLFWEADRSPMTFTFSYDTRRYPNGEMSWYWKITRPGGSYESRNVTATLTRSGAYDFRGNYTGNVPSCR